MLPCNIFWPIVFISTQILVGFYPLSENTWILIQEIQDVKMISSANSQLMSRRSSNFMSVFVVFLQAATMIQFIWVSVKFVQHLMKKKKEASLRVFSTSALLFNLMYGNTCIVYYIYTEEIVYVFLGSIFFIFCLLTIIFYHVYKKIIFKNHYFKNLEFVNHAFSMQLNLSHRRNVTRSSQTNIAHELQIPEDV